MRIVGDKEVFESKKDEISQYAIDNNQVVYFPDGYEAGLCGWCELDGQIRAVYDYDESIEGWARENGTSLEESVENFEYNCLRSLPYLKEGAPIFIHKFSSN